MKKNETAAVLDISLSQSKSFSDQKICYADMSTCSVGAEQRDGHWSSTGRLLREKYSPRMFFTDKQNVHFVEKVNIVNLFTLMFIIATAPVR